MAFGEEWKEGRFSSQIVPFQGRLQYIRYSTPGERCDQGFWNVLEPGGDLPEELKGRFYRALYNITGQKKTRTALTVMDDFNPHLGPEPSPPLDIGSRILRAGKQHREPLEAVHHRERFSCP